MSSTFFKIISRETLIKTIYDNDVGLIFLTYVVRMSFNYKLWKSINNDTNMK